MANVSVIDALVVELGLDPTKFTKGQKEAANALIKTRQQAKTTSDDIETNAKRAANYLSTVKNEVVGLVLAFAGAKGLTDLASGMVTSAAAAGRLSANIAVSTDRIGAWQAAVKEMGGTADEANGALNSIATAIGNYNLTRSTGNDAVFRALGVNLTDLQSGPEAVLLKIAQAGQSMNRTNYVNLLQRLGFGPSMIATLEQGRGKLEQMLPILARNAHLTQADADAAEALQRKWADLGTIIQGKARPLLTEVADALTSVATNSHESQVAIAALTGIIGSAAIGAGIAYAPFIALAVAIGAVALAYERLKDPKGRAKIWSEDKSFFSNLWAAAHQGGASRTGSDLLGVLQRDFQGGDHPLLDILGLRPSAGAGSGGGGFKNGVGGVVGYFMSQGFTQAQAMGIAAGIRAEGGGLGMATNGAFGIGQWRGPRYRELVSRYGANPTYEQQLAFLTWELKGGDRGGHYVGEAMDADSALLNYVYRFMRPQGAHWENAKAAKGDMDRGRRYLAGGGAIHLNGPITITTHAKNATELASQLPGAARRRTLATPANSSVQ